MPITSTISHTSHSDSATVVVTSQAAELRLSRHPFAHVVTARPPITDVESLLEGWTTVAAVHDGDGERMSLHLRGDVASLLAHSDTSRTELTVAATDPTSLARLVATVRTRLPVPPADDDRVTVDFWSARSQVRRRIDVPRWPDIRRNYTATSTAALDQLMALRRPVGRGHLVVLHGPPGTGKTTAIRALLDAWRDWADPVYLVDAEAFLTEPSYMQRVLLRESGHRFGLDDDDVDLVDTDRWRVLIAEDADEHLRPSARYDTGAGLGRLLNLTDGLLGASQNLIVVMTTNEDLDRIHPALTRPGRCLARILVGRLTSSEAAAWLDRDGEVVTATTLAELYSTTRNHTITTPEVTEGSPAYL